MASSNSEISNKKMKMENTREEEEGNKTTTSLSWDDYFMSVAFLSGKRSKDPVTKVGAVIVNQDQVIVGVGYNCMPKGNDKDFPWEKNKSNKLEDKLIYVCHAELNAIVNATNVNVKGCKIYVSLFPCNECAKLIVQSGIKEVIYKSDKYSRKDKTKASKLILAKSGVKYRHHAPPDSITIDFTRIENS